MTAGIKRRTFLAGSALALLAAPSAKAVSMTHPADTAGYAAEDLVSPTETRILEYRWRLNWGPWRQECTGDVPAEVAERMFWDQSYALDLLAGPREAAKQERGVIQVEWTALVGPQVPVIVETIQ